MTASRFAGARAADLLLQRAARRLPALHRARLADGDRPGAGRARPDAVDRRGRDRAVVGERVELLRAAHAAIAERYDVDLDTPWQDLAAGAARLLPLRHQRRQGQRPVPQPLRPQAHVHDAASRGSSRTSSGATGRPTPTGRGRGSRSTCRSCRARSATARGCGPSRARCSSAGTASTSYVAMSARRALEWVRALELTEHEQPDRAARAARDRGAARVPGERRRRLPDDRARGRDALRRRGAADPAGDADRLLAHRRALHPRRAVDRPAPARQRAADRDAAAAARPRQHGARRRARRGHDARGRPPRSTWVRARASTAATSSRQGTAAEVEQVAESLDRPVPRRHAADRGAGEAAQAVRLRRDRGRDASTTSRTSTSRSRSACFAA